MSLLRALTLGWFTLHLFVLYIAFHEPGQQLDTGLPQILGKVCHSEIPP